MRGAKDLVGPLLEAVKEARAGDNAQLLDQELNRLMLARRMFLEWLAELEEADALAPARFLRAWNDSTTRVVQIVRARAALAGSANRLEEIEAALDELGFGAGGMIDEDVDA